MVTPHSLILFDGSVMVIMIIAAYLSRRLGEALKIPPYYRLLYLTAIVIAVTAVGQTIGNDLNIRIAQSVPMVLRFVSALVAFLVCLKYWNWAFTEFFRK
jgi:hypothetical protein